MCFLGDIWLDYKKIVLFYIVWMEYWVRLFVDGVLFEEGNSYG